MNGSDLRVSAADGEASFSTEDGLPNLVVVCQRNRRNNTDPHRGIKHGRRSTDKVVAVNVRSDVRGESNFWVSTEEERTNVVRVLARALPPIRDSSGDTDA